MDIEELPEEMRDDFFALKHGSHTIECDITDALEGAEDFADFRESVRARMQDLIGEAQSTIATFCDEPEAIVLDAKKYAIWINGRSAAPLAPDTYTKYKTLWDIPFSYLPEYVFASGFTIAKQRLPSDNTCVNISFPTAKEMSISWVNVPEAEAIK